MLLTRFPVTSFRGPGLVLLDNAARGRPHGMSSVLVCPVCVVEVAPA
jgi:hypothetical protein